MAKRPDEAAEPEFAKLPHGIVFDVRLEVVDRIVLAALLYWAFDRSECVVSNGRLASSLGISESTVERSLRELRRLGYIESKRVRPTRENMTGRIILLLWRKAPSLVPGPPPRGDSKFAAKSAQEISKGRSWVTYPQGGEGPSPMTDPTRLQGPSPEMDRVRHP